MKVAALGILFGVLAALFLGGVKARDLGQWQNSDATVTEWYRSLMQPDVPQASCCGEADAYWCDDVHVRDGKTYCRITDDRPDGPRGRPHREIGDEFEIPPHKMTYKAGNPTGHRIIFLSVTGYVYCFVDGGGV